MARARNIKPGFFKNEILGVADPLYSILFEGLWVLADRCGRLEDRPLRIKGEIFPYRDGLNMDSMLDWLQTNGFILRYKSEDRKCILVLEFVKHQNPHKNEADSELPAPEQKQPPPELKQVNSEYIGTTSEIIGSTRADSLSTDSLSTDSLSTDSLIPDSREEVVIGDLARATPNPGDVCKAMKEAGMASVNPSSPKLVAMLDAGITTDELVQAATECVAIGKPFAYALSMAQGRREDAYAATSRPTRKAAHEPETFRERDDRLARERMQEICPSVAAKPPRDRNVIDITPVVSKTFLEA